VLFSNLIKETTWAILDKALAPLYGIGFIFVVVKHLPENEFGIYLLFQAFFFFIVLIDTTLVQTPMMKYLAEGEESDWAIPCGILLSLCVLFIGILVPYGGRELWAHLLNAPDLIRVLALLPWLISGFFLKGVCSFILVSKQQTRKLFIVDFIYFGGSFIGIVLLWGLAYELNVDNVITVNIFMAFFSSVAALFFTYRRILNSLESFKFNNVKRLLHFGKYGLSSGIANYFVANGDSYIISLFHGPAQVAAYGAAKIMFRLYGVFAQVLQIIVLPVASRLYVENKKDELRTFTEKSICFFFLSIIPINLFALLNSSLLFEILYNGKYTESIIIFNILFVGSFILPWSFVGSYVFVANEKVKSNFQIILASSLINFVLNLFLIPSFGNLGACISYVLSFFAGGGIMMYKLRQHFGVSLKGTFLKWKSVFAFIKLKIGQLT
jgi:O-antigen/teichoic acid export membrane protein